MMHGKTGIALNVTLDLTHDAMRAIQNVTNATNAAKAPRVTMYPCNDRNHPVNANRRAANRERYAQMKADQQRGTK